MPIDPRIPLGGQPVQPVDFWRVMAGAQQLAAQSHELRQAQRAEQDEMALREALQANQEDPDAAVIALQRSGNGPAALKLSSFLSETRKKEADRLKVQLDNDTASFGLASQVLDAVEKRPEMFPMASQILHAISPQVAQLLGPEYDPQRIATIRDIGLKENEKHNRRVEAFNKWKDERDFKASEPDRIARDVKLLGTWLSSASPGQYELFYENASGIGIDKRAIAMFDPQYSPEAIRKAELLTMTPEERATLAGQAESRDRMQASLDEAMRHNRVMEGLSAATSARLAQQSKEGRPLTATAESNIINRLSNQWTAATKSAREIERAVSMMDAGMQAARRGDMAAGSQAVLVTFQKILDPTSVVRESEYARSAAGQSLLSRIEGAADKLVKGGAGVPYRELEAFANLAREMARKQTGSVASVRERIGKTADRYNIPRELVLEGEMGGAPAAAVPEGGAQRRPIPGIPGAEAEFRNGRWIRVK